jgi:hypothetical protein
MNAKDKVMKKYLMTAAVIVALVGCGKSGSRRMGTAGSSETGSSADVTVQNTSITTNSEISSVEAARTGAAAGSVDSSASSTTIVTPPADGTDVSITKETTTIQQNSGAPGESKSGTYDSADGTSVNVNIEQQAQPPQPQQQQEPQQPPQEQAPPPDNQPQQQQSEQPQAQTGDQSNGDLSNRPAGAPGQSQSGSESSDSSSQSQTDESATDPNLPKQDTLPQP